MNSWSVYYLYQEILEKSLLESLYGAWSEPSQIPFKSPFMYNQAHLSVTTITELDTHWAHNIPSNLTHYSKLLKSPREIYGFMTMRISLSRIWFLVSTDVCSMCYLIYLFWRVWVYVFYFSITFGIYKGSWAEQRGILLVVLNRYIAPQIFGNQNRIELNWIQF